MGRAKGTQCRCHLDDTIRLADTTRALCDYLLRSHSNNDDDDGDDPGIDTVTGVKARCLAATEDRVASATEEGSKCPGSTFALSPPRTRAFWAGWGLFACYWISFGCSLASMAVEACRESFRVGDGFGEMDGLDGRKGVKERLEGYG